MTTLVVVFVLQHFAPLVKFGSLKTWLFQPWEILTYGLLHGSLMHLAGNLFGLFMFGSTVEDHFGSRRYLFLLATCLLGAALLGYLVCAFVQGPAEIIGISGAVFGVMYALWRIYPDMILHVLGIWPVKLKYLLIGYGVISFLGSLPNAGHGSNVAHSAHLGGLVASVMWFRYRESFEIMLHKRAQQQANKAHENREEVKREVDRILAKISQEGMGALTRKERQFLNRASKNFQNSSKG